MSNLTVNATAVSRILLQLLRKRPEIYDVIPPHGPLHALLPLAPPVLAPWHVALRLADEHVRQAFEVARWASILGEAPARAREFALRELAEVEELCPRWPRWPKGWPPSPPYPGEQQDMQPPELFVFGSRFLAASELLDDSVIQRALRSVGERAVTESLG